VENELKFKSDAFEAIHSSVEGLYRAGAIDKATMRDFDESCLSVPPEIELNCTAKLTEPNT
jgi:putative transcriptional regulator